jgi:RNA polymerase sigma factor (sigma-70 family)
MTKGEFEALYTKHQKAWLTLARGLVKDEDMAADVLQGVVVRLLARPDGLKRMDMNKAPNGWMRKQIMWYIKRFIWLNPDNRDIEAHNAVPIGDLELSLSSPELHNEEIETPRERGVQAALSKLSVQDQDILRLHIVARKPFKEIHRIIGCKRSPGALKKHYHTCILPSFRLAIASVGISAQPCDDNNLPSKDQTAA